jgi:membrane protease YdiL (CAAX protease family)
MLCDVHDIPDVSYGSYIVGSRLMAAVLAATLYLIGRRARRSPWMALGVGIMSVPVWESLLVNTPDMVRTFCTQGNVASVVAAHGIPAPPGWEYFLGQAVGAVEHNVLYPLAGVLVYLHGWRQGGTLPASWRDQLDHLVPMGRSIAASFRRGMAFFPILAAANLGLIKIVQLKFVALGADSYYTNMNALAAPALALAAGFGEEIVYRGVMQQGLKHALKGLGLGRAAVPAAIALQSIPFAYAHANYGNPGLLLFNVGFALLAGIVVEFYGLGCAIALHALIDFYAFFTQTPEPGAVFWVLVVAVSGAVVTASVFDVRAYFARRTPYSA